VSIPVDGGDPFEHDDAAYVLGALDPEAATAFEEHLVSCAACRARVEVARSTVSLLGPREELAGPALGRSTEMPELPETVLPALLRAASREQRRRRTLLNSLAAVAAACVIALAVALWPGGSTTSQHTTARAMAPVGRSPVRATVQLTDHRWGTSIDVRCRYATGYDADVAYYLRVVDRAGGTHAAGSWQLAPGGVTDFVGGTQVPRAQIAALQVTLPGGQPVLQFAVH
jgi:putative zinc finger protein